METTSAIRTRPAKRHAKKRAADASSANAFSWEKVRQEALHCRACPLWKTGTQTVFGEGPKDAQVIFVGEQPGDQEDLQGRPFVGPAGKLLDEALDKIGIDRQQAYVTNAVKHFKYELRGKRRLHKSPSQREVLACNPWLERELQLVKPKLVVALGATAARAVFGRAITIKEHRGRILDLSYTSKGREGHALVTIHPSFLLRVPAADRDATYEQFLSDLKLAAAFLRRAR